MPILDLAGETIVCRGIEVSVRESKTTDKTDSLLPLMEFFNEVQTPVVVVDARYRVLFVSSATKRVLELEPEFSGIGLACHQMICGLNSPCEGCLLHSPPEGPKSHAIQNKTGQKLFLKEELLRFPEFNVLIFFDVTREISSLRKLDQARKELKAKTILLERRRFVAADEKGRIQRMFDQLPDAFVQVTDEFEILNKNKSASEFLPHPSSEICYGLLGKEAPCPECPAQQGFQNAGSRKVIHRIEGRCFTEHVIQSSGTEGGMLLFRDTTRQIGLIEKIADQQKTIQHKNETLSNLVGLQTRLQKADVSSDMVDHYLDRFLPACHSEEALVLIDDIRPGCVWLVVSRGLDESQVTPTVRSYLSREVQGMDSRKIPGEHLPWQKTRQVELLGGNGRKVGMILFPESDAGIESELLQLFSEPFGAFIHNRQLLRQLEEKANTDALTGLYNRGYVEEALVAEKRKYEAFGIPYSVIVVDVNRLKQANDEYGHEAGDRLLLSVSERLEAATRETDIVARTGGDEFLLLVTDTPEEGAHQLAMRFSMEVFDNATVEVGDNEFFPVTVSLGVAGSDHVPHDDLLKTADRKMYEAKEAYYRTHKRYR